MFAPFADLRNPCQCGVAREYTDVPYSEEAIKTVDDPRRKLKEPNLIRKAANYTKAKVNHVKAGRPLSPDFVVIRRFETCQPCPLFKPTKEGQGVCTHSSCGCDLKTVGLTGRNKLKWADQECPYTELDGEDKPVHKPKWSKYIPLPIIELTDAK